MEKQEYFNIYNSEKDHWWYKSMRFISFNLIKPYIKKNIKILDAGCGTGFNMIYLKRFGSVFGIDNSNYAINLCKKRKLKVKKASIEKIPFKDNLFDLVTCFEVIYHKAVKDDVKALKEINRVLKNEGLLLIRVPAYKFLFSGHDIVVHTKRRYNLKELKNKLIASGFKIERITYVNFLLFPLIFLQRLINNLFDIKNSDIQKHNKFINDLLYYILKIESILIKRISLPFGVSIIALARKAS